jgi:hypothetical protein
MATLTFSHPIAGSLTIDTGIDTAQWAYGLNTVSYPTYGGEVIQILSVYIDDLTLVGPITTYKQMEAIFRFFVDYMVSATQGTNATPDQGASAYNLDPVDFYYSERNWHFKLYPMSLPGFTYSGQMVNPTWTMQAHVVDDSPDLKLITDGIKGAIVSAINTNDLNVASTLVNEFNVQVQGSIVPGNMNTSFSLSGNLDPTNQNPNTDPFQTLDPNAQKESAQVTGYADYYSSLISSYFNGDITNLATNIGSSPAFGQGSSTGESNNVNDQNGVKVPGHTSAPTQNGQKH